VIALLWLVALARIVGVDQRVPVLLLADGLVPVLTVAGVLPLAAGVVTRRVALSAVAGGTVLAYLVWSTPGAVLRPAQPDTDRSGTASVRLFTANLSYHNRDVGPIAEEIRATVPDVVAVQELTPDGEAGLRRSHALAGYRWVVADTLRGAAGIGLWSRQPLTDVQVLNLEGRPALAATVVLPAGRLRLVTVHPTSPLGGAATWRRQLAQLDRILRASPRPLVVAGDFNATRWHRGFARILATDLDDAHERRRRWWAATWPDDRRPLLPPLLHLDHVLVSPTVGVRAIREAAGRGSDHRPLICDLLVPPGPPSGSRGSSGGAR